jgi:hypothetical protein
MKNNDLGELHERLAFLYKMSAVYKNAIHEDTRVKYLLKEIEEEMIILNKVIIIKDLERQISELKNEE